MKVIHRYIGKDFLVTFLVTLLVFTFVMYIGAVVKAIDLISRGVPGIIILKIFAYNIPYILSFSIPISVMTSALLLFSRLSFDGEITALKASGLGMWQICCSVILLSVVLSFVCVMINARYAPDSHYARRQLLANIGLGIEDPIALLEEGRYVREFPNKVIYVSRKQGNKVKDIILYELDGEGNRKRHIRAKSGVLTNDEEAEELIIELYQVRVDESSGETAKTGETARYVSSEKQTQRIPYAELLAKREVTKKHKDMRFRELLKASQQVEVLYPDLEEDDQVRTRMRFVVGANERLALAFSCFAFTLLGVPLGMKSRRKESSVGIAISLAVVFIFYFFIILADSLTDRPHFRPDLIIWCPVILAELIGFWLIRRQN